MKKKIIDFRGELQVSELYLEDLKYIIEVLNESVSEGDSLKIETKNYEYDNIEELIANENKTIDFIEIKHSSKTFFENTKPWIWLQFCEDSVVYIDKHGTILGIGMYEKIKQYMATCTTSKKTFLHLTSKQEATKNEAIIVELLKEKENKSFWQRNKDKITVGVILLSIGAAIPSVYRWIIGLFKQ